MKPKSGVYSLMSKLTSDPAAMLIAPSAAATRIASPAFRPSRRTGAISVTPTTPDPMKLSRKSVPIAILRDVLGSERGYALRTAGVLAVILILGTRAALAERLHAVRSR
jgi:hypothetical protein